MKERTIRLNQREVEVLEMALETQKVMSQIKANTNSKQTKEEAINEFYNVESVEKKLKGKKWKPILYQFLSLSLKRLKNF